MKKLLVNLAVVAALGAAGASAQAQSLYGGVGVPGIYTLGYAHSMGASWGLRGDYAGGLSWSGSGTDNGVTYDATLKASRAGIYADWFPFGGSFRLVAGVTSNDMKMDINAVGTGTATINGKPVNMANIDGMGTRGRFNVQAKYPAATPYLGIGWGHHASADKGLGFYADIGVTFGTFTAEVDTNLVGASGGTITQADIDKQKQDMNDSLAGLKALPSVSLGVRYRF
jgi:hypothetical protein